jgi:uncharacterized membrane protein
MIKGIITILACSLLIAAMGIPLVFRKVPRNSLYGFRTKTTLRDDDTWYAANAFFGKGLILAGAITAVSMGVLYYTPNLAPDAFLKVTIATLVVPQFIMMLFTIRFIRKLKSPPGELEQDAEQKDNG